MESAPRPQAISVVVSNYCLAGGQVSPPGASLRQNPVAATQCTFPNYLSEILIFHQLSLDYNSRLFFFFSNIFQNLLFPCLCYLLSVYFAYVFFGSCIRLFLKSIWGYVNIIVFLCTCWLKTVLKNMYILRSLSI